VKSAATSAARSHLFHSRILIKILDNRGVVVGNIVAPLRHAQQGLRRSEGMVERASNERRRWTRVCFRRSFYISGGVDVNAGSVTAKKAKNGRRCQIKKAHHAQKAGMAAERQDIGQRHSPRYRARHVLPSSLIGAVSSVRVLRAWLPCENNLGLIFGPRGTHAQTVLFRYLLVFATYALRISARVRIALYRAYAFLPRDARRNRLQRGGHGSVPVDDGNLTSADGRLFCIWLFIKS